MSTPPNDPRPRWRYLASSNILGYGYTPEGQLVIAFRRRTSGAASAGASLYLYSDVPEDFVLGLAAAPEPSKYIQRGTRQPALANYLVLHQLPPEVVEYILVAGADALRAQAAGALGEPDLAGQLAASLEGT